MRTEIRISWLMVSKAFDKSKLITNVRLEEERSRDFKMWECKEMKAQCVEDLGLNPN